MSKNMSTSLKTPMREMLDALIVYKDTIPTELIVKCKELINLEKTLLFTSYIEGSISDDHIKNPNSTIFIHHFEKFYNTTFEQ